MHIGQVVYKHFEIRGDTYVNGGNYVIKEIIKERLKYKSLARANVDSRVKVMLESYEGVRIWATPEMITELRG